MVKSVLSNWAGLVVNGVLSFLMTPVIIHGLGNFYFGMWTLVGSFLDYYGLLDFGMRAALFRFVARFKGASQRVALNQTLVSALALTTGIGVFIGLSSVVLALGLPVFLGIEPNARPLFRELILILGVGMAITFPSRLLGTYLCGLQRFDLYNLVGMVAAIVRSALVLASILMGYGILAVAAATLVVAVLSLVMHWVLVRRVDPELVIDFRQTSWLRMRELASFSFYTFLYSAGDQLRFYSDSVVIARMLGVALVTPFSIVARLMEYFKSVVVALGAPVFGAMSELDGQAKLRELQQLFFRSTRVTMLVSLYLGSLLVLDGKSLLRLWLGESFTSTYPLLLVLTGAYLVALGQHPSQLAPLAQARHAPLALFTLGEGIANLALSIYWAPRWGLMGVALGTAVPMLFTRILLQPWFTLRNLELSAWEYIHHALLRPAAAGAVFLAIGWLALMPPDDSGKIHFAAVVGVQTALFAVLVYTVGLNPAERQSLWWRGKRLAITLRLARA